MSVAWPTVALGEVTRLDLNREAIDPSKTYSMVGVLSFARGLFDREPIENGNTSYKHFLRLKPDHIVMSQLFGWEGALALSDERFAGKYLSPQFPTFLSDERRLQRKFLGWLMSRPGFWSDLGTRASGMGDRRRTLNPDAFFSCRIPLPPLDEQRCIVARIDELAAKVAEVREFQRQSVAECSVLVDAYLHERFEHLSTKHNPTTLDQVLIDAAYGTSEKSHADRPKDSMPVLRIPNIASEKLQLDNLKYAQLTPKAVESLTLRDGDILIVRTNGSLDLVGRSAVVRGLPERTAYASYLIRLRFDYSKLTPEFAQIGLRHLRKSGALIDLARTTAGQYNISLGRLRNAVLPIPPLVVQRQIVAELEILQGKVDLVQSLQVETTAELDAMLPAILDKAFKGELRT